jgi:hypothetical protein
MKTGTKDAATLILCLGIVLLLPPIAFIFDKPIVLFGVPLVVLYMFGVWFALVFASFMISRQLRKTMKSDAQQ